MGTFVKGTLIVAAAIAALVVLALLLKLLVIAAIVAALGVGVWLLIRRLTGRSLGARRQARVTALTARR